MKKGYYFQEYGLDMGSELRTYKYIGRDYGDSKNANLGWDMNFTRFLRKNIVNKKEQKYKFCDTYSAWEKHVKELLAEEILSKGINNYDDMLHWLYRKHRSAQTVMESAKSILIPIYIGLAELVEILMPSTIEMSIVERAIATVVALFVIAVGSIVVLHNSARKVHFYKDFIEIAKKIKKK